MLYNINNKLSVGLGLGFQDFYQKYPRALYKTDDNETTSAVLSNSVQIIPLLAKAELYPLGGKKSYDSTIYICRRRSWYYKLYTISWVNLAVQITAAGFYVAGRRRYNNSI